MTFLTAGVRQYDYDLDAEGQLCEFPIDSATVEVGDKIRVRYPYTTGEQVFWTPDVPVVGPEFTSSDPRFQVRNVTYDVTNPPMGEAGWERYVVLTTPIHGTNYAYINQYRYVPAGSPEYPAFAAQYSHPWPSATLPYTDQVQVRSRNDNLPIHRYYIVGAGMLHLPTLSASMGGGGSSFLSQAPRITPQDFTGDVPLGTGTAGITDPARGAYYWGSPIANAGPAAFRVPLGNLEVP